MSKTVKVDDYISIFTKDVQIKLIKIRELILKAGFIRCPRQ